MVNVAQLQAETLPVTDSSATKQDTVISNSEVLAAFDANNLQELNQAAGEEVVDVAEEAKLLEKKQTLLQQAQRIDSYIENNRSLEPYDREYPVPVSGTVYLYVAQEYDVPLKYVMAIAQRESRFGTDRFTKTGNLTRPGQYENIVSMGLDDEGNNMSFGGWEESLVSFGKWYRRFDDAGVSDCQKWRIYNPNGDYCQRVEETASIIASYIGE